MQRLQALLSAYRLVTLTGPGGIGKTSLALKVGRCVLDQFEDGGWLVELAAVSDPNLVPSAVAHVLELKLGGGEVTAEAVARAVGGQHLLLVLDNCEHVIEAIASLAEMFVRLCPRTTILATSREAIRVEGEHVYRVPPLEVPAPNQDEPDRILNHSSVELFLARTRALGSDPSNGDELPAIAEICRHLDGIPLAVEFAAARAAILGVELVASGLSDRFALLTSGRRTAIGRHRTLRATLDWSYQLLSEEEQRILRHLAVFPAAFTLEAAEAVASTDVAEISVVEGISSLVAKSLLDRDASARAARWRLLETTRAYVFEKLLESRQHLAAARRQAEYFRDLLAPIATGPMRLSAEEGSLYSRELGNVRAALDWAFSPDGDQELRVALTLGAAPLLIHLSLLSECRERTEQALAALDFSPATMASRMRLSAALGWSLMYGVGRARETAAVWAKTLELAETLKHTEYQRHALWGLCIDQFNSGNVRTALSYAEQFAALVGHSDSAIERMMADRILATSLHYLGDQTRARDHIDRALSHNAVALSGSGIVSAGFDLLVSTHYFQARILWLQGYPDRALRVVRLNVEEGLALGHALSFCSVLGQSACPITLLSGDLEAATEYGAMLLHHTEQHPIRLWNIWARCFNGLVQARRGEVAAGLRAMREALEAAGEAQLLPRFLLLRGEYAHYLGEAGALTEAIELADQMLAACEHRDERWYVAELLRIKAELLMTGDDLGDEAEADTLLIRSIDEANRQGAHFWELRAATSLARLCVSQGRDADATAVLLPVYGRFTEGFATADLQAARAVLDKIQTFSAQQLPP
jgi:predicted ATPase